jgi:hypothetical protein
MMQWMGSLHVVDVVYFPSRFVVPVFVMLMADPFPSDNQANRSWYTISFVLCIYTPFLDDIAKLILVIKRLSIPKI